MDKTNENVSEGDATAKELKDKMDQRLTDRHSKLKEKWAVDRAEEVGEAGTVSAACKSFWDHFQAERKAISVATVALVRNPEEDAAANTVHLDALTMRTLALSSLISQNTHSLPKYDVKRALTEVGETRTQVDQARGKLVPRKKFAFGRKRENKPEARANTNAVAGSTDQTAAKSEEGASHTFSGLKGSTMIVQPGELAASDGGSDYFLKDLEDCVIVFMDPLSALKITNLKNCSVFCGPIKGSVLAKDLVNCRLHIASRQLRIHDSTDVIWFCRTSSPPIIEDCKSMIFAPYTIFYPALQNQLLDCGLVGDNLDLTYLEVKDFKWHRTQASPNWGLLDELISEPTGRGTFQLPTNTAVDGEFYSSEKLWKPPAEAFTIGFTNSLLPISAPTPPTPPPTSSTSSNQNDANDGDSDEDEL
jgi:hypothetical protein